MAAFAASQPGAKGNARFACSLPLSVVEIRAESTLESGHRQQVRPHGPSEDLPDRALADVRERRHRSDAPVANHMLEAQSELPRGLAVRVCRRSVWPVGAQSSRGIALSITHWSVPVGSESASPLGSCSNYRICAKYLKVSQLRRSTAPAIETANNRTQKSQSSSSVATALPMTYEDPDPLKKSWFSSAFGESADRMAGFTLVTLEGNIGS